MGEPRVVIVHDFMETYGGAERVLCEIAKTFPDAPVVAILGRDDVAERMGVADRFTSLLPQNDLLLRHYRLLTPVFPALTDRLTVPDADVVVSSSYAFAHRLRPKAGATTVCYCHSPLRFAWSMTDTYADRWSPAGALKRMFHAFAAGMRRSDRRAAEAVDRYLTQSEYTAQQIRRFYGREPQIVGVPLDCSRFTPSGRPPGDHYLFCARLVEPYKQASTVIEAFRRMPDERLVIAGDGPAGPELRASAPPNVEFVGHLDDGPLVEALQDCRALIFPSCDDFGLMPVEAMACGRPVLAYAAGGAMHTLEAGVTGELFAEQTPEAIVDAVRAFDPDAYDPDEIRRRAERWDAGAFRDRIRAAVQAAFEGRRAPVAEPARPLAGVAAEPAFEDVVASLLETRSDAPVEETEETAAARSGRFDRPATSGGGEEASPVTATSDA